MYLISNVKPQWSETVAVADIVDLVRREGQRVYNVTSFSNGFCQSTLCGFTISLSTGGVVQSMKAHDLEIIIQVQDVAVEQDSQIVRNNTIKKTMRFEYIKGNSATLNAWHQNLLTYHQAIRISERSLAVGAL
jgi:hypothetical protein